MNNFIPISCIVGVSALGIGLNFPICLELKPKPGFDFAVPAEFVEAAVPHFHWLRKFGNSQLFVKTSISGLWS